MALHGLRVEYATYSACSSRRSQRLPCADSAARSTYYATRRGQSAQKTWVGRGKR